MRPPTPASEENLRRSSDCSRQSGSEQHRATPLIAAGRLLRMEGSPAALKMEEKESPMIIVSAPCKEGPGMSAEQAKQMSASSASRLTRHAHYIMRARTGETR